MISGELFAWNTTDSVRMAVSVIARDWSSQQLPYLIDQVPQHWAGIPGTPARPSDLPNRPTSINGQLGMTQSTFSSAPATGVLISQGPNTNYVYFSNIPFTFHAYVQINDTAMSANSAWWTIQRPVIDTIAGTRPLTIRCDHNAVLNMRPLVVAHEGPNRETNSHVAIAHDTAERIVRQAMEPLVYNVNNPGSRSISAVFDSATRICARLDGTPR